jgi:hypothetical protein
MLMCLKGCDVSLRDLIEANEDHLHRNMQLPEAPYKTPKELVENSIWNLRDKSSMNLAATFEILQKTKSLTVIQRSPSKLFKDHALQNKKTQQL